MSLYFCCIPKFLCFVLLCDISPMEKSRLLPKGMCIKHRICFYVMIFLCVCAVVLSLGLRNN